MIRFDTIIIGGGLAGMHTACRLQKSGQRTVVISKGISLHKPDFSEYRSLGGRILMGDSVIRGEFEGGNILAVYTENLGQNRLEADNFILASGKFLSGGLVADMEQIYEPLFGLDVEYDRDRNHWFAPFDEHQGFMSFGVKADELSRPFLNGRIIINLYAAGEILAGVDPTETDSVGKILAHTEAIADRILGNA